MIILHGINQFLLIIHNNRPPRRNRSSIGSPERINIQVSTCVGLRTMHVPCRFMIATSAISNVYVCPSIMTVHTLSHKNQSCVSFDNIELIFLFYIEHTNRFPHIYQSKRLGWPIVSTIPPRNNPYIPYPSLILLLTSRALTFTFITLILSCSPNSKYPYRNPRYIQIPIQSIHKFKPPR